MLKHNVDISILSASDRKIHVQLTAFEVVDGVYKLYSSFCDGCEESRCKRCDDCRTCVRCYVILCSDCGTIPKCSCCHTFKCKHGDFLSSCKKCSACRSEFKAIKMIFIVIIVLMVNSVPNANHIIVQKSVLVNIYSVIRVHTNPLVYHIAKTKHKTNSIKLMSFVLNFKHTM